MKQKRTFARNVSALLLVLAMFAALLAGCGSRTKPDTGKDTLSLWTDDSLAKEELQNYMAMITKEGEDYIPPEDRIAVFDLDGTLFCETDPNYFDRCRRRLVTSVMS